PFDPPIPFSTPDPPTARARNRSSPILARCSSPGCYPAPTPQPGSSPVARLEGAHDLVIDLVTLEDFLQNIGHGDVLENAAAIRARQLPDLRRHRHFILVKIVILGALPYMDSDSVEMARIQPEKAALDAKADLLADELFESGARLRH